MYLFIYYSNEWHEQHEDDWANVSARWCTRRFKLILKRLLFSCLVRTCWRECRIFGTLNKYVRVRDAQVPS